METGNVLRLLKSSGGTSDQACAGLVEQINNLKVTYTVCGSLSFCVEFKQISSLNTALTQVVTVALLVVVGPNEAGMPGINLSFPDIKNSPTS